MADADLKRRFFFPGLPGKKIRKRARDKCDEPGSKCFLFRLRRDGRAPHVVSVLQSLEKNLII